MQEISDNCNKFFEMLRENIIILLVRRFNWMCFINSFKVYNKNLNTRLKLLGLLKIINSSFFQSNYIIIELKSKRERRN